jgi:hypothetical protein
MPQRTDISSILIIGAGPTMGDMRGWAVKVPTD